MYGMMPPGFPGMPGMDMLGKGGKTPATANIQIHLTLLPLQEGLVNEMVHLLAHHQGQALLQEMEEITKMEGPHQADLLLHQCHKPLQGHLLHLLLLQWLECLEE